MARKIFIGEQDFVTLRENNYFYIDKTEFIRTWWEDGDNTTAIMRPRRFGKTLNMSMVNAFFSIDYEGRGQELFGDLRIWQYENMHRLQGKFPVIFLSFAMVKGSSYGNLLHKLREIIAAAFKKHAYLLESDVLDDADKAYFAKVRFCEQSVDWEVSINKLSAWLSAYYQRKVIILLDEYDAPMQEAYAGGFWQEMTEFMRPFFNASFKSNAYMDRALMTGITRVARESIFSDLNHLAVVTVLDDMYNDAFGFSETEVFAAMDEYGLTDREGVKAWYDGFSFGNRRDVYNPWSIINFLKEKGRFDAYWANTSANRLISNLLQSGSVSLKKQFECLLQGRSIWAEIDNQVVFHDMTGNTNAIWSLFVASGYLTGEKVQAAEPGRLVYELRITNYETRCMFDSLVSRWFQSGGDSYNEFIEALLHDDVEAMEDFLNDISLRTFSFFDVGKLPGQRQEPERFYHGFVLGMMVDLREEYVITSNRESGFGRYDIMLEPRNDSDNAIIIEFKVFRPQREKNLAEALQHALRQIEERNYAAALEAKGIPQERIRKYGFVFEGKKVVVGRGK